MNETQYIKPDPHCFWCDGRGIMFQYTHVLPEYQHTTTNKSECLTTYCWCVEEQMHPDTTSVTLILPAQSPPPPDFLGDTANG